MPGSLKNKLLQFEAVPPADAWEKIAIRLDNEFVAGDGKLALKLENAEIEPPSNLWAGIEAELDEASRPASARVAPMYRKIAVAAAIIGVLILGTVYFLRDDGPEQELVNNNAAVADSDKNRALKDSPSSTTQPGFNRPGFSEGDPPLRDALRREKRALAGSRTSSSVQPLAQSVSYSDMDIDPKPVQMVSAMEPVQVEAPPIRDKNGNVIMDLSVISKPNEAYITVTSPSGSQTKISKKFLSCLNYMNGSYSSSDINYEGQQWTSRFAEWRNKISEAGFVPGANNFFDIFELQELIRD